MKSTTTLTEALAEICATDIPLAERLSRYAAAMRESGSPFASEYDRLVARLRAGEAGAVTPEAGDIMPPFLFPDSTGRMTSLSALLAHGPVILSFNRGHWCPFCKIELRALAEAGPQFAKFGAQVVSIMPERQSSTASIAAELLNRLTVLSDIDNGYAMSLGLVMSVGDVVRQLMAERGWSLDIFQGNDAWLLPLPATFVVGREGRILARFVDPDFRTRMAISDILTALQLSAI
ncbi:MAG: peroxiredoxin-like family protein [Methylocella sp.]